MKAREYEATITVERGDDEEIELTVRGSWARAERDVGFPGGVDLDDRVWLDGKVWDGDLTPVERERAVEAITEQWADDDGDGREWDEGDDFDEDDHDDDE